MSVEFNGSHYVVTVNGAMVSFDWNDDANLAYIDQMIAAWREWRKFVTEEIGER